MELRHRGVAGLIRRSLAVVVALLLLAPAAASAQDPQLPRSQTVAPRFFERSAKEVERIAERASKVRAARRDGPLAPTAYTRGVGRWQVSFFRDGKEVVQVQVDDRSGAIVEQWSGYQVAWRMARGYSGAFGRKLNAPYVWIPLCALFLLPFLDFRRPFRLLHLDLLVLLGFGASHVFFNRGDIGVSVPLVYPVLLYLLVRMLLAGLRPRGRPGRLVPYIPMAWLAVALVFLVGFRVALNVVDSNVIDVGYAGRARRGPDRRRPPALRRRLLTGRAEGRHLRPRQLPALRAVRAGDALERALGRPAGRPRSGDRLRPVDDRRAAATGTSAEAGPGGNGVRGGARLCLGRLPLHGVRARDELQRHTRRARLRGCPARLRAPLDPSAPAWRSGSARRPSSRRWP